MADAKKPPQLLELLKKSQAFAESLLQENDQLRLKLAAAEERLGAAETERDGLRRRISDVQLDTASNTRRFQVIDEELNNLANLHVATWQVHSTLVLREVIGILVEICVNLVGANEVVVYVVDEKRGVLVPALERATHGAEEITLGKGPIGELVASGEVTARFDGDPPVVIPLRLHDRTVGAVVIRTWLLQKRELTTLDGELFAVIRDQGATALYSAYLAGAHAAPLSTDPIRAQLGG